MINAAAPMPMGINGIMTGFSIWKYAYGDDMQADRSDSNLPCCAYTVKSGASPLILDMRLSGFALQNDLAASETFFFSVLLSLPPFPPSIRYVYGFHFGTTIPGTFPGTFPVSAPNAHRLQAMRYHCPLSYLFLFGGIIGFLQ
jgi:hypothetical protein